MDQDMSNIERSIHAERRQLDRNLATLEEQARSLADWRTHYGKHTWAAVGVAVGTGALVGIITGGRPRGSRPGGGRPLVTSAGLALANLDPHGRAGARIGETWDHILDALMGVASTAAISFVSKHVPGFEQEFAGSQPMRSSTRS